MTCVNLIVAVDNKWGISKNNTIPWHIKEDLNFFTDVTKREYQKDKRNAVIIGKNTWDALKTKGLKDRITIIVSTTMIMDDVYNLDCYVVPSLVKAMHLCSRLEVGKIFIGGGSRIYKEAIETLFIDEIYMTEIDGHYECDNFFPGDVYQTMFQQYYKIYMTYRFDVVDQLMNKQVSVKFTKAYRGEFPPHLNINHQEHQYLGLLEDVIKTGDYRQTRNAKVWSKFGKTVEFDLSQSIPVLTTRKVFVRGAFEELIFFLSGKTNATLLSNKGVKFWEANTSREFLDSQGLNYREGDLGPLYPIQWCHYGIKYEGCDKDYKDMGFDQVQYCLDLLKTDPFSRRILMTSYNPVQAKEGCLFPCHGIGIQFYVELNNNRYKLSCMMTQRSSDLGCAFHVNSVAYSLLVYLMCHVINHDPEYKGYRFVPGRLIINLGDYHIYDHREQCIRLILRDPFPFPTLSIKGDKYVLEELVWEDLELMNYQCYPNVITKMTA